MSEDNTHLNQLNGEDAQAFAAKMLDDAHLLGTRGTGGEKRVQAIEECFAHTDHEVDLTNRPLLTAVLESKPSGKPLGGATPGIKPKPPEMK